MPARVAAIGAEVLANEPAGNARVAAIGAEVLAAPNPGRARTAQIAVEVLHSLNAFVPPGGGSGRWFRDLWDEEMIDDPGEQWQE